MAGRVTLSDGTTLSDINTLSRLTREETVHVVSGARHFVQYLTYLAVPRETGVLKGAPVTTHNFMHVNAP